MVLIEHEVMGPNLTPAEGYVLGVGAKMFTIAGPVIVYGTVASVVYAVICIWVIRRRTGFPAAGRFDLPHWQFGQSSLILHHRF